MKTKIQNEWEKDKMEDLEKQLSDLRQKITHNLSEKRAAHILAVEQMAVRIGQIYAPEKEMTLRAAALLHDITKELKKPEQLALCRQYGLVVTEQDLFTPKVFHARTAAALIPSEYPAFASNEIIGAVRWHTTGRRGMTLAEKIIYLADYIDDTRTYRDCVKLREMFWQARFSEMTEEEKAEHLRKTLICSFDYTVKGLLNDGDPVVTETFEARNDLILEELRQKQSEKAKSKR